MLSCHFLFDNAFLLGASGWIAESDDSTSESVRMVLRLQLHFLLLVELDGVKTILVQVR